MHRLKQATRRVAMNAFAHRIVVTDTIGLSIGIVPGRRRRCHTTTWRRAGKCDWRQPRIPYHPRINERREFVGAWPGTLRRLHPVKEFRRHDPRQKLLHGPTTGNKLRLGQSPKDVALSRISGEIVGKSEWRTDYFIPGVFDHTARCQKRKSGVASEVIRLTYVRRT